MDPRYPNHLWDRKKIQTTEISKNYYQRVRVGISGVTESRVVLDLRKVTAMK
jgi:hypothetical protein